MIGTREICALLLAGGMGAGSVVGVQQVKPALTKASKPAVHKPARQAVARRAVARPAPQMVANDCPTITAPLGPGIADLAPMQSSTPMGGAGPEMAGGGPFFPGGGEYWPGWNPGGGGGGGAGGGGLPPGPGGGDGGGSVPGGGPVATVPQPASWVMMIAGFGLVGLALRRGHGAGTVKAEPPRNV